MVTYQEVLDAFIVYAAGRSQSAWCDLWILAQRRMEALLKDRFKGKPPVDEFDGIITDATAAVLGAMNNKVPLCEDDVSRVFWNCYMNTVRDKFRELKKWRYLKRLASILNSASHVDGPESPAVIAKFWKGRKKYTMTKARLEANRANSKKGGRPRKAITGPECVGLHAIQWFEAK